MLHKLKLKKKTNQAQSNDDGNLKDKKKFIKKKLAKAKEELEPQSNSDQLTSIKEDIKEIKEVVNSIKGIKEAICNPK